LCYLVGLLCGLLAYVIYGLQVNLCPSDRQSYPYSSINNEGVRARVFREEVSVFGQLYKFDTMQNYFMEHYNMNLTKDFQGMELSSIFDGDTNNDCAPFKQGNVDPTLPSCTLNNPYGKIRLNAVCLATH
jgi:chitin synthase